MRTVVLLLHGGKEESYAEVGTVPIPGLRTWPIGRALRRAGGRQGLVVHTVRYRYQGWNGDEASPATDADTALSSVRRMHGEVPVVLVGHSMGARAALRVAGDASVRAVVALAPWTPPGEPVAHLSGRRLLMLHGSLDRVTHPHESAEYAARAAAGGADVARLVVRADTHAMLLRWRLWHRLVVEFVLAEAGLAPLSLRLERAFEAGRRGQFSRSV